MNILEELKKIDTMLYDVNVHGDDVFRIAQVRQNLLRIRDTLLAMAKEQEDADSEEEETDAE